MTYVLRGDYAVAASPARIVDDDLPTNAMVTLPAGLPMDDIPEYERAQLAPEHFVDAAVEVVGEIDGRGVSRIRQMSDVLPDDWRDDSARERDERQRSEVATFQKAQDKRRAQLRAAAKNGETG